MAIWAFEGVVTFMNALTLIVLAIIGVIAALPENNRKPKVPGYLWAILALCVVGALVVQLISAKHHHDNSTDLARHYEDKFDGMPKKRNLAALVLIEYLEKGQWSVVTNETDGLDSVLGFFDRLGYDEQHGMISAKVVHQYFDGDVRVYYQASRAYIQESQLQGPDSESTFEYIKPLFENVLKVESKKTGRPVNSLYLSNDDLVNYLNAELRAVSLDEK